MSTNSSHDIDREITELEGLIKKLQTEIVEMTKSANKPLPNFDAHFLTENDDDDDDDEENGSNKKEANHIPVKKDDEKEKRRSFKLSKGPHNPDVFPIIIKNDSVLEAQAKMFAENMANLIKISDPDIDTLDDVRRNFSMLWDDEDVTEDISSINDSPPKPLNDPSFKPSDNPKTQLIKNVFIESFDTLNINTQEELNVNFPIDLKDKVDKVYKTTDDNTQTKLKDPDCIEFNGNTAIVSDKRNRNSTIIMQAKTSGNPLKDNTKNVHIEKDSGAIAVSIMDKPTEIITQKDKPSINKTSDDNTQTKLNDPDSTEFNRKVSMASANRNRNSTIIMQANTSGNPVQGNTKKVYKEKDTGTTSVSVTDKPTEMKTEPLPKTVITDIKNAMQNILSSSSENTSISSDTNKHPSLAEKLAAKSESYSIIKTLRRIVGKDSAKSIHREEKNSQDQNCSTGERKSSIIIKDNHKKDTNNIVTGLAQSILPKLGKEENLGKEMQQASSSSVEKNKEDTTVITHPKRNYEIVPINVSPVEEQEPSAPSANSNELANFINNSNLQTLVSVNTKGTSAMPKELENMMNPVQESNTDVDNTISSTHKTIPDAFSQNVIIEDAKTVLRNTTSAAGKKSGAVENPVVITDGLAEGDIHNKCESVGNDDDTFDDEDDSDDDDVEEGDSNNPYDVD
ncbi:unnamed protein product [Spodoptera littoralis]|uniref:Uncharacterized protein n=1 Tax=Spodoptera littoralis TaxID=7109 RepID=A0A9P0N724_SPOLI|nr:unnamed protein product [Spodoptera littoralis]CAH1643850.1 unnamed protein product [Spodoptera littoralis]